MSDDPQLKSRVKLHEAEAEVIADLSPQSPFSADFLEGKRHEREQAKLESEAARKREHYRHIVGLILISLLTLASILILLFALAKTISVITDPQSSAEAKQIAAGIAGAIVGAVVTFTFTTVPQFFDKKKDGK